jgi:hypothetical protein
MSILDREVYPRPRGLSSTARSILDREVYPRPRGLPSTARSTVDREVDGRLQLYYRGQRKTELKPG